MTTPNIPKLHLHLAEQIRRAGPALSDWFQARASVCEMPFYSSVDIRDSGHKIAPVDCNLFPGGLNNICPEDMRTAPAIFAKALEACAALRPTTGKRRIALIPESHTGNAFYIDNVFTLKTLLTAAGFEVEIGWVGDSPETPALLQGTEEDHKLHPRKARLQGSELLLEGDYRPDVVILNNDFSGGYPGYLDAISQQIVPSHKLGWHSRRKSAHFRHYNQLALEAAELLKIDPWILTVDTTEVAPVDFNEDQGIEECALVVDATIARIAKEYADRKITSQPVVFIKSNAGTYGMGIHVVKSGEEIRKINRRVKNKLSVGKNRSAIKSVIVQEGIPTITRIEGFTAEPVIYLVGRDLVGGFLRTNPQKNAEENLNSQGMVFRKLCMSDLRTAEADDTLDDMPILEAIYGTVARIAALAAAREIRYLPFSG